MWVWNMFGALTGWKADLQVLEAVHHIPFPGGSLVTVAAATLTPLPGFEKSSGKWSKKRRGEVVRGLPVLQPTI